MFPPGRARLCTRPEPTGSATAAMTIGMVVVACFAANAHGVKVATITSTGSRCQLAGQLRQSIGIPVGRTDLEGKILPLCITELAQSLP